MVVDAASIENVSVAVNVFAAVMAVATCTAPSVPSVVVVVTSEPPVRFVDPISRFRVEPFEAVVAGPGRSFATCQLGDDRPIIVRVGDKIGEYTVRTIERGRVVFTTANGSRLEVLALRPGS